METTKKEMIHLLRQMGNKKESVEWFKQRNDELKESLQHISVSVPQLGGVSAHGCSGDTIGKNVVNRENVVKEIEINEKIIEYRLSEYAELARVMIDALTEDERNIIWERHAEGVRWEMISLKLHISRSHCFRIENVGIEKLCLAWDKYMKEKNGG